MKNITLVLICISLLMGCKKKIEGCMDAAAENYNAEANEDDGSCRFAHQVIYKVSLLSGPDGATQIDYYDPADGVKTVTDANDGWSYSFTAYTGDHLSLTAISFTSSGSHNNVYCEIFVDGELAINCIDSEYPYDCTAETTL